MSLRLVWAHCWPTHHGRRRLLGLYNPSGVRWSTRAQSSYLRHAQYQPSGAQPVPLFMTAPSSPLAFMSEWARQCQVWMGARPPKGFEKFFKDGKNTKQTPESSESEDDKKPSTESKPQAKGKDPAQDMWNAFKSQQKSGRRSGGGDGKNPWGDPQQMRNLALFSALVGLGTFFYVGSLNPGTEISWKEFMTKYLSRNNVHRLVVVNNKQVQVETKSGERFWFSIGSVDTFERNLENAQLDLQMDPSQFVPVTYTTAIEASQVVGALPSLLLLGGLIYFLMKGRSMMGMGGPRGPGGGPGGKMTLKIGSFFGLIDFASTTTPKPERKRFRKCNSDW